MTTGKEEKGEKHGGRGLIRSSQIDPINRNGIREKRGFSLVEVKEGHPTDSAASKRQQPAGPAVSELRLLPTSPAEG